MVRNYDGPDFVVENTETVQQTGRPTADIPAGTVVVRTDQRGNLFLGPNNLIADPETNLHSAGSVPDFAYQQQSRRVFTRSLILAELGDPPDLVISRAGPDDSWPDNDGHGISGVVETDSLGSIRFQGSFTPKNGTPGVTVGGGFQGDSAAIYARAAEDNVQQTNGGFSQGGELYLATAPNGTDETVDRLIVRNDGTIDIPTAPIEFTEITDPGNGLSNTARLYCRENGGGKTELCCVFNSGAVQVLATEP